MKIKGEIKRYTMEDTYRAVEALKNELPIEITFNNDGELSNVNILSINENGWVTYTNLDYESHSLEKIRVRDLVGHLETDNNYLLDYVLKNKV